MSSIYVVAAMCGCWLTESEEKDEVDQMIDETLRRIDK